MAISLGVDGFCQPADLELFTGKSALSEIPLDDQEQAIKNGFGVIEARLMAIGIPKPQLGYTDEALLRFCLPINARLAASQILMGLHDTARATLYQNQANQRLDEMADSDNDGFLDFVGRQDSDRNLPYGYFGGAFGAGGLGAGGQQGGGGGGGGLTAADVYTLLKRMLHESNYVDLESNDSTEQITIALRNLADVALNGSYNSLNDRPTIPDIGANPQGNATEFLTKLLVGATVYGIREFSDADKARLAGLVIDKELGFYTDRNDNNPNDLTAGQYDFINYGNSAHRQILIAPVAGHESFLEANWHVGFQFQLNHAVLQLDSYAIAPHKNSNDDFQGHFSVVSGNLPSRGATNVHIRTPGTIASIDDLAQVAFTGRATDLIGYQGGGGGAVAEESTQAQAEAGTDDATANASRMTPRRTKEAITAQTDDLVAKADLEGHENDLFYNAQGATAFLSSGTTYKVGGFTVCTDGTTQPGTGDGVDWSNIQDGNYRFALGRGRTDRDGNASFTLGDALDAADYPVGKVIHMQPWQPYQSKAYAKLTLLTEGVLVGSGNAAYVWFRATVDEVGNIEDGSDYWKITDFTPSQLDLDIPVDGVAGAMRTNMGNAQLDAQGNDTAPDSFVAKYSSGFKRWSWNSFFSRIKKALLGDLGFLSDARSPSDPYDFTGNYTYKGRSSPAAKGEWNLNAAPALNGVAVGIVINFKDADEEAAKVRWLTQNEFVFGTARFKITGSVNLTNASLNQYQATVQLVAGAEPANNAAAAAALEPDSPHRNEFSTTSFKDNLTGAAYRYARTTGTGDMVLETPRSDVRAAGSAGKQHVTEQGIRAALDALLGGSPLAAARLLLGTSTGIRQAPIVDVPEVTAATTFDSGTDTIAQGEVQGAGAIPIPAGNADTPGLELVAASFGQSGGMLMRVLQGDGQGDITMNANAQQSVGAAWVLYYKDSVPTSATDGTSLGNGSPSWNGNNHTSEWTVNDAPEGRYYWLKPGATTTINAGATLRTRFNYNRITQQAETGVLTGGSTGQVLKKKATAPYYEFAAESGGGGGSTQVYVATGSEVSFASNVYTVSPGTGPSAYAEGLTVIFEASAENQGATDINLSTLGNKDIVREDGTQLQAGDIPNDHYAILVYDGIFFVLLNRVQPTPKVYESQGTRRILAGKRSGSGDWNGIKVKITPSSTTAKIKVAFQIDGFASNFGSNNTGENPSVLCGRWRATSGSDWKAFGNTSLDYSSFGMRNTMNAASLGYLDWWEFLWIGDFEFTPGVATEIEVQFAIRCLDQPGGLSWETRTKYYNRAASSGASDLPNSDDNGKFPQSWIEVSERKEVDAPGTATPISYSETTAIES